MMMMMMMMMMMLMMMIMMMMMIIIIIWHKNYIMFLNGGYFGCAFLVFWIDFSKTSEKQ